jgi:hypothetical protein
LTSVLLIPKNVKVVFFPQTAPAFSKSGHLDVKCFGYTTFSCRITHTIIVNCFLKCGFTLNQTNDGEDATELSIAEDDWDQLKAGVSFQEYVSCDVTCEVQTLEQIMGNSFTSDVCEEGEQGDGGGKSEPQPSFLSALEGIDIVRKYFMKFDVDDMMAALSSIENEAYRVQQKAKKQHLTLMDMWKK